MPDERRSLFQLRVAYAKLWQAGRRGDLSEAREAMRAVEEAVAAQPADRLLQLAEHRVAALTTVGVVELWTGKSLMPRVTSRRRASWRAESSPYQEIGALAHLGVAVRMNGETFANGLRLLEQRSRSPRLTGGQTIPSKALPPSPSSVRSWSALAASRRRS